VALFALDSYTTLSVVLQTTLPRIYTMPLKMNSILDAQDIFLWPDGYWCFREDFYQQPRQAYTYRLVRVASVEWQSMRGYPLVSPSQLQPQQRMPAGGVRT
jgi:hypothetical protein